MLKSIKNYVTGIWDGKELHDKELLTKYVLIALALTILLGLTVNIPSCEKKQLPPHIQTNAQ